VRLRTKPPTDFDTLRSALLARTSQWKSELQAAPEVARLAVRHVLGPIKLGEPDADFPTWIPATEMLAVRWQAFTKPDEMLEGLVEFVRLPDVASPTGVDRSQRPIDRWFRAA
jgi:hypothetical protein